MVLNYPEHMRPAAGGSCAGRAEGRAPTDAGRRRLINQLRRWLLAQRTEIDLEAWISKVTRNEVISRQN